MLTDDQQQRVWEGLFFAEVRSAYFGALSNRYHRRQRWLSGATLFLSSGAVVAITTRPEFIVWNWLPSLLSAATALLSAVNFTAQLTKTAIEAGDLHARWASIANDWQTLWDDQHAEDAVDRLRQMERRSAEIGKAGISLPYYPKEMEYWQTRIEALYPGRETAETPSH